MRLHLKNRMAAEVQKLFKEYASSIGTNVSLVDYYMTTQANAASGYTADGGYNVQEAPVMPVWYKVLRVIDKYSI